MSVYYEAIQSGRLHLADYPEIPAHSGKPARRSFKGIRAHLREVKLGEAEDRNSRTPHSRTKAYRRDLERLEARVTKRDAAGRAVRHG